MYLSSFTCILYACVFVLALLHFFLSFVHFQYSVNQEIKCGNEERACQDKMIKLLMMQGARPFSSTKKLAKVKMPSTFYDLA